MARVSVAPHTTIMYHRIRANATFVFSNVSIARAPDGTLVRTRTPQPIPTSTIRKPRAINIVITARAPLPRDLWPCVPPNVTYTECIKSHPADSCRATSDHDAHRYIFECGFPKSNIAISTRKLRFIAVPAFLTAPIRL